MEVPVRFELTVMGLQPIALPLGYGIISDVSGYLNRKQITLFDEDLVDRYRKKF